MEELFLFCAVLKLDLVVYKVQDYNWKLVVKQKNADLAPREKSPVHTENRANKLGQWCSIM